MSQTEEIPSTTTKTVSQGPNLSELAPETLYDKMIAVAHNLWWCWHPDVISLFRDLDPIRWRQLDHNPIALLAEFTPERLEMRAAELVLDAASALRAGDALHLACAEAAGAKHIATLADVLSRNAQRLKIKPVALRSTP